MLGIFFVHSFSYHKLSFSFRSFQNTQINKAVTYYFCAHLVNLVVLLISLET